ncbi:MAG: DUF3788 family protein [Thermoanaerobaculia bacterium]|nr:DUF3788 family protein [Thermoanaerobaculia bacterium]
MALSAFADPSHPPGAVELLRCLGGAAPLWKELVAHVAGTFPPLEEIWTFAGAKFGWSLRLKREDRVLLYLTPGEGCFLAGLVLGEKAVAAAAEKGLPPAVLGLLAAAPKYAEGRGLRLRIAPGDDLEPLWRLVALKADVPPKARRRALAAVQPPT